MVMLHSPVAEGISYVPAVFGLLGSLIGGFIAGAVSLLVARQARDAAEGAWIRDNRREIYDRLLTYAQKLLIACEAYKDAHRNKEAAKSSVESAFTEFWEAYGVVQTVAGTPLVDATRVYSYRLWELATSLGSTSVMGPEHFPTVAQLTRSARHNVVSAMRAELGLGGFVIPEEFNPFVGTALERKYAEAEQVRPGPLTLS